jgi:DNA-binding protein HU-beta
MNKSELIDAMAQNANLTKAQAKGALEALTGAVTTQLQCGEDVTLAGFGTWKTKQRAARQGRNPQTGAAINIAASCVPSFKAGKNLKEAVNG